MEHPGATSRCPKIDGSGGRHDGRHENKHLGGDAKEFSMNINSSNVTSTTPTSPTLMAPILGKNVEILRFARYRPQGPTTQY